MEDLLVVALPADVARALGAERVLLAGVEYQTGAKLHGWASAWTVLAGGGYDVPADAWRPVPQEHRDELERLFAAALPPREEPAGRSPKPAGQPRRPRGITLERSRRLARAQ